MEKGSEREKKGKGKGKNEGIRKVEGEELGKTFFFTNVGNK